MKLKFTIDKEYDKYFVTDTDVLRFMDGKYKSAQHVLELTKELYQQSWNEIGTAFSDYIKEATGFSWYHPEYECIISVIHSGLSNWGTAPKIVRGWKENPYSMRRVTAHELIVSHYFEIYKRNFNETKLADGQVWALAEIAAFALTSLRPEVKDFWPWDTEYYTNHNYQHIVDLQNKLKPVFLEMNFVDYIKSGIVLVKQYPSINPKGV